MYLRSSVRKCWWGFLKLGTNILSWNGLDSLLAKWIQFHLPPFFGTHLILVFGAPPWTLFPSFQFHINSFYKHLSPICDFHLVLYIYESKCVLVGHSILLHVDFTFTFALLKISCWPKFAIISSLFLFRRVRREDDLGLTLQFRPQD